MSSKLRFGHVSTCSRWLILLSIAAWTVHYPPIKLAHRNHMKRITKLRTVAHGLHSSVATDLDCELIIDGFWHFLEVRKCGSGLSGRRTYRRAARMAIIQGH